MVRTMIKKSDFTPWLKVGNNIYKIMFSKEDMMEDIRDEEGNPTGEKVDTDYCIVTMEIFYYKPSADFIARLLTDNQSIINLPEAKEVLDNLESDSTNHLKQMLLHNVKSYDTSEKVNQFIIHDKSMWLPKADRVGLQMRFTSEKNAGKEVTTLWTEDGYNVTLNIDSALLMLYSLEEYASKCFDNTMNHISIVSLLDTCEDILGYDYTVGYPEMLIFE